jgi:hypothetical protein
VIKRHAHAAGIHQDRRHLNSGADQCASSVCSTASFHGLIFASAFASVAFATSVS